HKASINGGCGACHLSHSSDQPNLLIKAETPLCLSCHDPAKAPFKPAHENSPVETAKCTSCHDPHPAAQPGLLKTSAHAPVSASSCDSCHNSATAPKPFAV